MKVESVAVDAEYAEVAVVFADSEDVVESASDAKAPFAVVVEGTNDAEAAVAGDVESTEADSLVDFGLNAFVSVATSF